MAEAVNKARCTFALVMLAMDGTPVSVDLCDGCRPVGSRADGAAARPAFRHTGYTAEVRGGGRSLAAPPAGRALK